ncbi:MAG TPA: tol-pal system protein YbgF [Methylomirabilota bacterium]|nr:tol-pal system protein YbgF [Methylomirabilota bacterium]
MSRVALAAIAAVVLLGGCTGVRRDEVRALAAQVTELRKSQDDMAQQLAKLRDEMKALDAQSSYLVGEAKASADQRRQVQSALEQQERAIVSLRAAVEEAAKKTEPPPPPAPAIRPPPAPPQSAPAADKLFASAMAAFRAEEHGQAVLEFIEITEKFPRDPLAPTAQYWIGEAYYRQKDYRQALVEFEKVVDGYPQSPQVAEALLKVGLCFRALHDVGRAREAWERVVKNYAGTEAASQARTLLASLGGSGRRTR